MLLLDGKPILERTISLFNGFSIIVATAGENFDALKGHGVELVEGGVERQDSIANALKKVPADTDLVIVHDGARPLAARGMIDSAIEAAERFGAAVVGVPVKDTIKHVSDDGFIQKTPDRDFLWKVQTPQVFRYNIIKEAYARASHKATDDSKLVEDLGYKVKMVMGSYENIKITTPEDLIIAEAICTGRQKKSS